MGFLDDAIGGLVEFVAEDVLDDALGITDMPEGPGAAPDQDTQEEATKKSLGEQMRASGATSVSDLYKLAEDEDEVDGGKTQVGG